MISFLYDMINFFMFQIFGFCLRKKILRENIKRFFSEKFYRFIELRNFDVSQNPSKTYQYLQNNKTANIKDVFWFHVASAGELEQAIPICEALIETYKKTHHTDLGIVVSYFSPSTEPFLKGVPNLVSSFGTPWDTKILQEKSLNIIENNWKILGAIFVRYDIWPNLLGEFFKRNIDCHLIAASQQSARPIGFDRKYFFGFINAIKMKYLKNIYSKFKNIFVIEEKDLIFFRNVSTKAQIIHAGDPKWARAKARAKIFSETHKQTFYDGNNSSKAMLSDTKQAVQTYLQNAKRRNAFTIVFGSPHREEQLVAFQLANCFSTEHLCLVVAPPELSQQEIQSWQSKAAHFGVKIILATECSKQLFQDPTPALDAAEKTNEKRLILLNTMGMLAELYADADLAVIGGGFDGQLHNVLEPASLGVPVTSGPKIARAPEASYLHQNKALIVLQDPQLMFQFLSYCVRVKHGDLAADSFQAEQTLDKAKEACRRLFERIPNTSQIVSDWVLRSF